MVATLIFPLVNPFQILLKEWWLICVLELHLSVYKMKVQDDKFWDIKYKLHCSSSLFSEWKVSDTFSFFKVLSYQKEKGNTLYFILFLLLIITAMCSLETSSMHTDRKGSALTIAWEKHWTFFWRGSGWVPQDTPKDRNHIIFLPAQRR